MDNPLFSDTQQIMQRIEHSDNSIVFSSLHNFFEPVHSKGFAIKYVAEGSERYVLNNEIFDVQAGNYLLCNATKLGHVEIESAKNVKGICINIIPAIIHEVAASFKRPDSAFPDIDLGLFLSTDNFIENQYQASSTAVGKALHDFQQYITLHQIAVQQLPIDFFYTLAEKIVVDQQPIYKQLQSIPVVKSATKRQLFKQLQQGKFYIDHHFATKISINQIAQYACMSEYHFFRLFKSIYKQTPHQYILFKRLQFAKKLLQQGGTSIAAIAYECGFVDVFAFSKAFKQYMGCTPSSLLRK
ncbi:helix-turn-helix transcriptional regulator [Ferruginibacter yonginensis]|uniref:Helix-turn-helix transcriptional regulator n=1 Tax=Ferruginibacter yonginensis TaxID=1310416 RepID=A0ABV8QPP7_9BACT